MIYDEFDPCLLCGYPKGQHRSELLAHHSECTLEQYDEQEKEYAEACRRNWEPFHAKMNLLWNPPVVEKSEGDKLANPAAERNLKVTTPKPTSKEPRFGADCPACGVNAKGKKSHHKGGSYTKALPRQCASEGCEFMVDPPRQRCEPHAREHSLELGRKQEVADVHAD